MAATIVQIDRRRTDSTAYLSLLRCANDEETLERVLALALEYAGEQGCDRLVGPTGPTPSWQTWRAAQLLSRLAAFAHGLQSALSP